MVVKEDKKRSAQLSDTIAAAAVATIFACHSPYRNRDGRDPAGPPVRTSRSFFLFFSSSQAEFLLDVISRVVIRLEGRRKHGESNRHKEKEREAEGVDGGGRIPQEQRNIQILPYHMLEKLVCQFNTGPFNYLYHGIVLKYKLAADLKSCGSFKNVLALSLEG